MVKNKSEYDETKMGINEQELLLKRIERAKIALVRLNAKLCVSAN